MREIYMSYDITAEKAIKLKDSADILNSDITKLKDLIADLNQYWVGSAATAFTNTIEEYNTLFNKYCSKFQEDREELDASSKSYKALNEHYLNMEI